MTLTLAKLYKLGQDHGSMTADAFSVVNPTTGKLYYAGVSAHEFAQEEGTFQFTNLLDSYSAGKGYGLAKQIADVAGEDCRKAETMIRAYVMGYQLGLCNNAR